MSLLKKLIPIYNQSVDHFSKMKEATPTYSQNSFLPWSTSVSFQGNCQWTEGLPASGGLARRFCGGPDC
jgi:hypothetical protein